MVNPYPSYPSPPSYPPTGPPRSSGDIGACIGIFVLTGALWSLGAFCSFFLLAFLDYCPTETCSADNALYAVAGGVGTGVAIGVGALVLVVVRVRRGRPAWPFALVALFLVVGAEVAGVAGYFAAVGAY